jgi:hypothetical protein
MMQCSRLSQLCQWSECPEGEVFPFDLDELIKLIKEEPEA